MGVVAYRPYAASIGTVHATPSFDTLELLIALATSRVFCRLPPGSVQPAATGGLAGPPAATGGLAGPPAAPAPLGTAGLTAPPAAPAGAAAAALEKQAGALELPLLLLPQPPAASPAAATRDTPATAGRQRVPIPPPSRPVTVCRSTPMTA